MEEIRRVNLSGIFWSMGQFDRPIPQPLENRPKKTGDSEFDRILDAEGERYKHKTI